MTTLTETPAPLDPFAGAHPRIQARVAHVRNLDDRRAIAAEWHYRMNTEGRGWRPSDLLARVVSEFAAGRPFRSRIALGIEAASRSAQAEALRAPKEAAV
jgi:hypothetical protein